uniref:Uncharacterized protein n=1 Tax=Glossina palpalis gambiensis TaxID=67801 RepID=A0A1B0B1C1_9MUSC
MSKDAFRTDRNPLTIDEKRYSTWAALKGNVKSIKPYSSRIWSTHQLDRDIPSFTQVYRLTFLKTKTEWRMAGDDVYLSEIYLIYYICTYICI